MRIKIDENMPLDVIDVLENAGHDAHSVYSEGIEGCSDRQLIS
jgi:predicted nuclease of predicted toxin-antitoxin system